MLSVDRLPLRLDVWSVCAAVLAVAGPARGQPVVEQAGFVLENDDGPTADDNTAMAVQTEVQAGQRFTVRFRLENTGDAAAQARYGLQMDPGDDQWTELGSRPGLTPSRGLADVLGAALARSRTGACAGELVPGVWWYGSAAGPEVRLGPGECTELAFVLQSGHAEAGDSYRLRVWNRTAGAPLSHYAVLPSLAVVAGADRRVSKQSGLATMTQILGAEAPYAFDAFGSALAVANQPGEPLLVVGAPGDDTHGGNVGRVYVFQRAAGAVELSYTAALDDATPTAGDALGTSVAAGDLDANGLCDVVAGSPGHDAPAGGFNCGEVSIFLQTSPGVFAPAISLADPTVTTADRFGTAVAVGDVNADGRGDVIVGAPGDDTLARDVGQAHLFLRNVTNDGFEPAVTLDCATYAPGASGWNFGTTVAAADLNADGRADIAVGAPTESTLGPNVGRVHVFLRDAANTGFEWLALSDPTPTDGDNFGAALAAGDVDGDGLGDLVVGAHLDDSMQPDQGQAYVFLRRPDNTGFLEPVVLNPPRPAPYAHFGWSIAVGRLDADAVDDVLVAAVDDVTLGATVGRAFAFVHDDNGFSSPWVVDDAAPTLTDRFGRGLAIGDFDLDGWGDIAAGAPGDDGLAIDAGNVVLLAVNPSMDAEALLDERGYEAVYAADGALDMQPSIEAPAVFTFRVKPPAGGEAVLARWQGLSTAPHAVRLEILRFTPAAVWELLAEHEEPAPLTPIALDAEIARPLDAYQDDGGDMVCRVVQEAGTQVLFSDLFMVIPASSDHSPPVQSDHSPVPGALLSTSSTIVHFAIDEPGHCRWSQEDLGYEDMYRSCQALDPNTSQACAVTEAPDGELVMFIACRDLQGNADTTATNTRLAYEVDTVPPPAARDVGLFDTDATPLVDGRDLLVTWTPPERAEEVVSLAVYIIPVPARLLVDEDVPVATVTPEVTSWQGTADLNADSLGRTLVAASYRAYVTTLDAAGHLTVADPSPAATLSADLDDGGAAAQPQSGGCACGSTQSIGAWWAAAVLLACRRTRGRRKNEARC